MPQPAQNPTLPAQRLPNTHSARRNASHFRQSLPVPGVRAASVRPDVDECTSVTPRTALIFDLKTPRVREPAPVLSDVPTESESCQHTIFYLRS